MLLLKLSCAFVFFYIKIINVLCEEGSSLVYVMDETYSMQHTIHQIKREALSIMDIVLEEKSSEIKDFALFTVNDPDVTYRIKTNLASSFQEHLNRIRANNMYNRDCGELTLTAVERALLKTRPRSYIYVFTDASAKDYTKADNIKKLCQMTQSQVVFILTGHCGLVSDKNNTVYQTIAEASSGQVISVGKYEVHTVQKFVNIMIKATHSPIKWESIQGTGKYNPIKFNINETTNYIMISTSGTNVNVMITKSRDLNSPQLDSEKIMWNDNSKVLKVNNLESGAYHVWVKGESNTTVVIYMRTDFTFEHGFSTLVPKTINETSNSPTTGRQQHLSINKIDPEHTVDVISVHILDVDENVIKEVPLKNISHDFYTTDAFISPNQTFKIGVNGKIKLTGLPITRISKMAIDSKAPIFSPEPPVITNDKHSFFGVEGDTILVVPCNVTGFPDPVIVWKFNGVVIKKGAKYDFKGNNLHIINPNMTLDTGNVTCQATNELGFDEKTFETIVTDTYIEEEIFAPVETSHFNINKDKTSVFYINSSLANSATGPVRWYVNGVKIDHVGNGPYVINNPTVSDDGNYTCRVNTDEGPKSENFVVYIGFAPSFENSSPSPKTIDWNSDDEYLDCSVNSKPTSKIVWTHDGKEMNSIENVTQSYVNDWGHYTCTVSNVHETIQREFNVITSGCYIKPHMTNKNMPLLSEATLSSIPDSISNSDIKLNKHKKVKFSCPTTTKSPNNFHMFPNETEILAECDTRDEFIVNGKKYRFKDLQCKIEVEPSVVETPGQCNGTDTELLRVGFAVNGFLNTYTVCYNKYIKMPVYARSPVTLRQFGTGADVSKFKWTPSQINDGKQTGSYTCKGRNKCCYEKGQLVNVNELAFGPAQVSTFIENVNSVPIWIPCEDDNRMSWESSVENILQISDDPKSSSWTGLSTFTNKNGGLVPRYLWKLIYYKGKYSAIVYVNDESPIASDVRCSKPCELALESLDKYRYCCRLEEFMEAFGVDIKQFS